MDISKLLLAPQPLPQLQEPCTWTFIWKVYEPIPLKTLDAANHTQLHTLMYCSTFKLVFSMVNFKYHLPRRNIHFGRSQ